MDNEGIKARMRAIQGLGGTVPEDAERKLDNGEVVAVAVTAGSGKDAIKIGFELEQTGNAVIAVACDTTDDPRLVAGNLGGGGLRLLSVRNPWTRAQFAERAGWFTELLRAGGGSHMGISSAEFASATPAGSEMFGLAEVLNATGALSHSFLFVPESPCPCGCGGTIKVGPGEMMANLGALAHIHFSVVGFLERAAAKGEEEDIDIARLYAAMQRRVMMPQMTPVHADGASSMSDDDVRRLVGGEVINRMVNGGGAWLMFTSDKPVDDGLGVIVDVATDDFGKSDALAKPVADICKRLLEAGMLTGLDCDNCLPAAKTFSVGSERLTMLGYITYSQLPHVFGPELMRQGTKAVGEASRYAETRYRGRALLAAASLDYVKETADKALLNKGKRSIVETSALAIMRAGALLSALGEVDSGSHLPRGAAAAFLRPEQVGFFEDVMDFGRYGLTNRMRLFPSAVMRFAVGAILIARKGSDVAAKLIEDAQNACAVAAQAISEECKASDNIDGGDYFERAEQSACDLWWNAWHGQSAQ